MNSTKCEKEISIHSGNPDNKSQKHRNKQPLSIEIDAKKYFYLVLREERKFLVKFSDKNRFHKLNSD